MEVKHTYIKEEDSFIYTIIDQASGNILNEEKLTQTELAQGKNVDLGSYVLKDQGIYNPESTVSIETQAHIGDGKTQTFLWGEKRVFHDNLVITHKNMEKGTERAFESILVAVYTDDAGKTTSKEVWTSGKVDYQVDKDELRTSVQADYDYRKDSKGTTYYFKEKGYKKVVQEETEDGEKDTEEEGTKEKNGGSSTDEKEETGPPVTESFEYVEDATHNVDGLDDAQTITPIVEEESVIVPPKQEKPTPPTMESVRDGLLPQTGDSLPILVVKVVGWFLLVGVVYIKRNQLIFHLRRRHCQVRRPFSYTIK